MLIIRATHENARNKHLSKAGQKTFSADLVTFTEEMLHGKLHFCAM